MKKLFLSLIVVAAVSFTACGGATKTEATETTEVAAPEAPAAEATVFSQYVELTKQSLELAKKIQADPALATSEEAVKFGEEYAKFATENAEAIAAFTAEELAEIANLAIAEAPAVAEATK